MIDTHRVFRIGLLASIGATLDAFFPEMVEVWRQRGHVVFPAAGTESLISGSAVIPGISRNPSFKNARAISQIKNWAREDQLDVVVTSTATASALARLTPVGVPVVYFAHGLHWSRDDGVRSTPWKLVEFLLSRRTDAVIVLNEEDELWFRTYAPNLLVKRLPFGVGLDPSKFPPAPQLSSETINLVWIGEMIDRKNPIDALRVVRALKLAGAEVRLSMLGEGPLMGEVKNARDEFGLTDEVALHGRTAVYPHIRAADALIHTARWEGLPRVFLEALAVHRPIFSYDVKGVRGVPCVVTAESGDVKRLAQQIQAHLQEGASEQLFPDSSALSYESAALSIESLLNQLLPRGDTAE